MTYQAFQQKKNQEFEDVKQKFKAREQRTFSFVFLLPMTAF